MNDGAAARPRGEHEQERGTAARYAAARGSSWRPAGLCTIAALGAWRSLVARTVRVGEVPGSNPGAPISSPCAHRGAAATAGRLEFRVRRPPRSPARRGSSEGPPAGRCLRPSIIAAVRRGCPVRSPVLPGLPGSRSIGPPLRPLRRLLPIRLSSSLDAAGERVEEPGSSS